MPKKIYELAKELEMQSLDLVEKLKSLGFSVRNHMSSLSEEDIEKLMTQLEAEKASKKGAKKKTKRKTTKKKAAKKKTAKKKVAPL